MSCAPVGHSKQASRKEPAIYRCVCSNYSSGHFFRTKSALYNHRRAFSGPDEIIETGEDLEGGKGSFLHVSQLKIRILIDEFDVGYSTPAQDIAFELEGNDVAAISNDISNEQPTNNEQYTAADEMLEELSDITEMDSGSKFPKHISLFLLILFIDEDTFNRQDPLNRILAELSDDSGVDSGSIFPN